MRWSSGEAPGLHPTEAIMDAVENFTDEFGYEPRQDHLTTLHIKFWPAARTGSNDDATECTITEFTEDELAYDGSSDHPPARWLTPREQDVLTRTINEILAAARRGEVPMVSGATTQEEYLMFSRLHTVLDARRT